MVIIDEGRLVSVTNAIYERVDKCSEIHKGSGSALRRSIKDLLQRALEAEASEHDQARIAFETNPGA